MIRSERRDRPSPVARETVEAFASLVEAGRFLEAMERFYAPDVTVQENQAAPRAGLATALAHERATLARFASATGRRLSPVVIDGERVVIHWEFVFRAADGSARTLEELA